MCSDVALIDQIVHEIGQPLRTVARRVRRFGPSGGGTVVMLAGCKPAMGCSTTAMALGVAAGEIGPTVVVDGDSVNRGLSQGTLPTMRMGWNDVIHGSTRIVDAMHAIEPWTDTTILPLTAGRARTGELIGTPRFARLLADMRRVFQLVVVDAGNVHGDGSRWAPWVDVAILVCDAGENLNSEWAAAWDLLEEKGAHVLGVIETNA